MTTHTLEIPFAVDLTRESAWIQNGSQKFQYFVARLHLIVESSQYGRTTHPGEILATFQTKARSATKTVTTFEKELSFTDIDETLCSQIMSESFAIGITSEIAAKAQIPLYTLSSKAGASISHIVESTLNIERKVTKAATYRQSKRFEIQNEIFPDAAEKIHAVACLRRLRQDVYLHYIDYLFVNYEVSLFGLRKKKINLPRPENGRHVNRVLLNQPLFSILHWELLSESSMLIGDAEYQNAENIANMDEIEIIDLERAFQHPLPYRPERPTLYTLSNIAFPYKWIDRKGEWTREALMKIELEEAEGSLWWFQHGPGRIKKH
jgi:hypothetical protein